MNNTEFEPIHILLVEDNLGDIRLTQEALKDSKIFNTLSVVNDGKEALSYLKREGKFKNAELPDIILLDLDLPEMDGREFLSIIKNDPKLRLIPIIVLTVSQSDQDVLKVYNLQASCYITKPVDLDQFLTVVKSIENFWFSIVKLPGR